MFVLPSQFSFLRNHGPDVQIMLNMPWLAMFSMHYSKLVDNGKCVCLGIYFSGQRSLFWKKLQYVGIFNSTRPRTTCRHQYWLIHLLFSTGWERMVLQILFLGPSNLLEPNASFAQMSQKLIVSPIVKTLVFSKVPEKVCSCDRWKI